MRRLPLILALLLPCAALMSGGCLTFRSEENRFMEPRISGKPAPAEERGAAPLAVRSYAPADGYAGPARKIEVVFNEPVKRESVENHLFLGDERHTLVRCKYLFYDLLETSAVLLEMIPLDPLLPGKTYYLNFGAGIESRLGVPLAKPFRGSFVFSETPLPRE